MPIKNRFAETHAEITGWRRHLHMHPELGFDVHNTAKFVEERLREFGITDITTGIGKTGVVAAIKGRTDTLGRVIGLRADMDALPIHEATGLEYSSKDQSNGKSLKVNPSNEELSIGKVGISYGLNMLIQR